MNKSLLAHRSRNLARGVVAAVLVGVATSIVAAGSTAPIKVEAAAGNPRVPGNGTIVFIEDFENGTSADADPPLVIGQYVGATGMTYNSSAFWSSTQLCNGIVLSADSVPDTANADICDNVTAVWVRLKELSGKLSNAFGGKFTVASYTAGDGEPGETLQIQTKTPIAVPPAGAYLTMAVDTGAYNCNIAGPQYFMSLTEAGGSAVPVVTDLIDPCNDPDRILDNGFDKDAYLIRTVGDAPALVTSTSVILNLENQNIIGRGNDATIDNLTLLDVSPQLDKEFDPASVQYGETSTVRFIITNTYSPNGAGEYTRLDPKLGWEFTDSLPEGLTMVGAPTTGSGAEACANFSADGSTDTFVSATGDLVQDQVYCVVEATVTASAPGEYTNLVDDVTTVGIKPPDNAKVTFVADPKISMVKSAALTDANGDEIDNAGDTIQYSFEVTNLGNVPLENLVLTDPVAGSVTCAETTLPVGKSTTCVADNPYTVTQADVDAGSKFNSATAEAVNTFDPTQKVTAEDNTTTPLEGTPSMVLDKSAATPVDVNESGITDAGDTIQYSFTVTNTGNVTITDLVVTDPLAGTSTCDTTTIAPGAVATCTADAVYVITDADETSGVVKNVAISNGKDPDGETVTSNEDQTETPVAVPDPKVSLTKVALDSSGNVTTGPVTLGTALTYQFTVTNDGNVTLTDIKINDSKIGTSTCEKTTLAPGESTKCTADDAYVVTAADVSAGKVTNVATTVGLDPDGDEVVSEEATVTVTTRSIAVPKPGGPVVTTLTAGAILFAGGALLVMMARRNRMLRTS